MIEHGRESILAVIPARGGSKGFPGKNTALLAGKPLIAYTVEAARAAKTICGVIVSTDSAEIGAAAASAGADVPILTRPAELAQDDTPMWPVIRHAVEYWERTVFGGLEAVAVLQPTSPLRTAEDIDACVKRFRELEADICVSAVKSKGNPFFNLVIKTGVFASPLSFEMRLISKRQDAKEVWMVNGAVYIIRRKILDKLENQFMIDRYAISEMPDSRSVDIDEPEDMDLAEFWLKKNDRQ